MHCHGDAPSFVPFDHVSGASTLSHMQQGGDQGCAQLLGAPRVQPLNDYRLLFMVQKGLATYLKANNVYAVCGSDYRLYATPIIKFQKACYQLVNGNAWYLSGEQARETSLCVQEWQESARYCPALVTHPASLTFPPLLQCASPTPALATPPRRPTAAS